MFFKNNRLDEECEGSFLPKTHECANEETVPRWRTDWLSWKLLALSSIFVLNLQVIYISLWGYNRCGIPNQGPFIYSPAEEAVEYHTVVFNSNFGNDRTIYQGPPTDDVDTAWEELYNDIGLSQIDKKSAARLPNRTSPIDDSENQYIVGLDVFHQLHCLNHIRKLLYPDRYHLHADLTSSEQALAMEHIEHCIDSLRQSLTCSSDISTIYWEWSADALTTAPNARTTHVCRDFAKLQAWARHHRLRHPWDPRVHVDGSPIGGQRV